MKSPTPPTISYYVALILSVATVVILFAFVWPVPSYLKRVSAGPTLKTRTAYVSTTQRLPTPLSPYTPPAEIKAIYITSNTALSASHMTALRALVNTTELNAVVININDGRTSLANIPALVSLV